MHVFTYGSLMFPEVWARVTGGRQEGHAARLRDHECRAIRGQTYPALVPKPGAVTDGVIYFSVGNQALARLDLFEGDFYNRIEVTVETAGAEMGAVPAQAYAAALPDHPDILPTPWHADVFRDQHLERFLGTDPGFSGRR